MKRSCQWGHVCCCSEVSKRGSRLWELSVGTTISSDGAIRSTTAPSLSHHHRRVAAHDGTGRDVAVNHGTEGYDSTWVDLGAGADHSPGSNPGIGANRHWSEAQVKAGDYTASLQTLAALRAPVDAFFDDVMVNAEEMDLRLNRQGLLKSLHVAMNRVADLSRLAA